jgi:hypothetical protein
MAFCIVFFDNRLHSLKDPERLSLVRYVIWSLAVFTREPVQEPQAAEITTGLATAFHKLLQQKLHSTVTDALNNCLWAFSNLSTSHSSVIDSIIHSGIVSCLVLLLRDNPMCVIILPVLRTLGNVIAGTAVQAQSVLDSGILDVLQPLLRHKQLEVRKETAWIAANIVAGNEQQVDALLNAGILKILASTALNDRWTVRKEAIWALATLCAHNDLKYIQMLLDVEGLDSLVGVLAMECPDEDLICKVLDALHKVLDVMGAEGRRLVEEHDGDILLGAFVTEHPNDTAATKKATDILQLFFGFDSMEDEENNAPGPSINKTFEFGISEGSMCTPFSFGDKFTHPPQH